jgi:hypothetical protein
MKIIISLFILLFLASPVFAQTSNTTTTSTSTTNTGTTNATVTSPGNVIVSTPNGTIGNQVNTPANTNNVYVITPGSNGSNNNGSNNNHLSNRDRDASEQRNYEREYDRAQSQHDYRDRANYYNIRRNQAIESDNGANGVSQTTRRNYQADYHSNYPSSYNNHH